MLGSGVGVLGNWRMTADNRGRWHQTKRGVWMSGNRKQGWGSPCMTIKKLEASERKAREARKGEETGRNNDEEDGRRWREGQKQGWNVLWTEKSYYELQSAIRLEMMRWWAKQTLKLADLETRGQCPAESRRSGGLQCYILFCNLMIFHLPSSCHYTHQSWSFLDSSKT